MQALQPDVVLARSLCPAGCVALDVGANVGIFSAHLREIAGQVHAFEPNPYLASQLRTAMWFDRRVVVHQVALSDDSGNVALRLPLHQGKAMHGLATIDGRNALAGMPTERVLVPMARLDDMRWRGRIGFVKIDVEGHELAVLEGGRKLFQQHRPTVLLEAEERHRPGAVASVIQFFDSLGRYRGRFPWKGSLLPIESFDRDVHQRRDALDELSRLVNGADYTACFVFAA
jgi:FkbM family methyltransferase